MNPMALLPAVLTLEEAAAYLRLPPEIVEQEAALGHLPGRQIAHTWRFLKAAIDAWLQRQDSRAILLQQVGALADDETMNDLLAVIYARRGRSETEEEIPA